MTPALVAMIVSLVELALKESPAIVKDLSDLIHGPAGGAAWKAITPGIADEMKALNDKLSSP